MMAVSRLLKSWAMPPASRPIASIFCDCRSCSSVCALSVRIRRFCRARFTWLPAADVRDLIERDQEEAVGAEAERIPQQAAGLELAVDIWTGALRDQRLR